MISIKIVAFSDWDVNINVSDIIVEKPQGILRSYGVSENYPWNPMFPKGDMNIEVVYTHGYTEVPDDIKEAMIYLCAEQALGFVGARTGGGSLTVQSHGRQYGNRGKYQDIRNDLSRQAHFILSNYRSSVVGA